MKPRIVYGTACPICARAASAPFRRYDERGKVLYGCVDHFHEGHISTPSESSWWHARPAAKLIRAALRTSRNGYVTVME